MKVLVTGAHGFIGQHVIAALKNTKHEVLAPKRKSLNLLQQDAGALASYLLLHRVKGIIHLAALCGGIGINKDNPGKFMYQNLQMGINVIEACRLAKIKKLVNLSTVCSYPKNTPVPFKESDIWNGYPEETNAPYGIAKKTIVELGIAYSKQYKLNVTNLVPVNMAGEYDHFDLYSSHVLPALIRKFEEAQALPSFGNDLLAASSVPGMNIYRTVTLWGTGSASREFLYAGDCARAIVMALDKDTGPEPINLGTGEEITIKELAELVKSLGGYTSRIEWEVSRPDGQPRRCLDTFRAWDKLGWKATTPLRDTVQRTIDWYRANNV